MKHITGPKPHIERAAQYRDTLAGFPSPGFDPTLGFHVCPQCRAQQPPVTTRVDRPRLEYCRE